MSKKDFAPIEGDYAFFVERSTEAESDSAEYARQLAGFAEGRDEIRLLDFGCGTGEFTHRLLSRLNWPSEALWLSLIEPVSHQREQAVRRLASFSRRAVESLEQLPQDREPRFDVVVSNHVLYYVEDLGATIEQMLALLRPGGKMLPAIAGWDNPLLQIWKAGFASIGQAVPYHAAEEVEACLARLEVRMGKTQTHYVLRFPDTTENRLKYCDSCLASIFRRCRRNDCWAKWIATSRATKSK